MGAKSKYQTQVEPFLATITERLINGHSEKAIAADLHVGLTAWNDYKKRHPGLKEAIEKGRVNFGFNAVRIARAGLLKRAEGFTYTEQKKYRKRDKETGHDTEYIEELTRYAPPDVVACHLLLKNFDRPDADNPGWENDPGMLLIKQREIALKEKLAARDDWQLPDEDPPNG